MNNYDRLEKRIEKIEEKQIDILTEIATFKPILEALNENVKKIGENSVDKARMQRLEDKVLELETELEENTIKKDAEKWNKAIWIIISAIITIAIGYFIGKK